MPPLLMITHNPFWRADRGSRQRICALVHALRAEGWRLHVAFDGAIDELEAADAANAGVDSLTATGVDHAPQGVRGPRGWPLEAYRSATMPALVRRLAGEIAPRVVLCQQIRHAYLLDSLPASLDTLRVCDTHDVMHQRCLEFTRHGYEHWVDISAEREAEELRRFDLLIAIHEEDAATLRTMAGVPVVTAPHTPALGQTRAPGPPGDGLTAGFIGCAGHANRDAVACLLDEVWPRALALLPRLRLLIAGDAGPLSRRSQLPVGVRLLGRVESLAGFYSQIDIAINPVRFGGGLKIKNVEAMFHGRPLVTTPEGTRGMREIAGRAAIVAETADALARAVADLADDPERRASLSRDAAAFVAERFNPDLAYRDLLHAIAPKKEAAA